MNENLNKQFEIAMEGTTMRALLPRERKYTFKQSHQLNMQTGLIGYLRADFGTNGNEFWSTWHEGPNSRIITAEFRAEFDEVINSLRCENNILNKRSEMSHFCYVNSAEIAYNDERNHYGMRVDTKEHSYLMRLNPNRGEYNLYCYCYKKDWLDSHLEKAERGIRFIDSNYKDKFRIADGEKIRITFANGETSVRNSDTSVRECRYIDDYHLEVGNDLYHICQFAEIMERNGNKVEPIGAEENA